MPRATLSKREDGRYRCRYKGKEFYGNSVQEAFEKRDAYKHLLMQGMKGNAHSMTVREYSAKWLPTHRSDVNKRTYNTYANYLDKANELIGDMPVMDVTHTDIRSVYNIYSGKSQSSIDKMVTLIKSMFESALHDGYIRFNPCDDTDRPKGTVGTHRALTEDEDKLILDVEHPMRLAVLFMRYAGLRRGEVLALTYEDVDLKNNIIHVNKAVSFDGNKPISGLPKTDAGIRAIPLLNVLKSQINAKDGHIVGKEMSQTSFKRAWEGYINAVEKHINGCQKRWYGLRREDKIANPEKFAKLEQIKQSALLAMQKGKINTYNEKMQEYHKLRLEGWKDFTIRTHDLRHSYVTMLCDANVEKDLAVLWVGHADEKMINQIYDHVSEYRKQKATNDVEALLKKKHD